MNLFQKPTNIIKSEKVKKSYNQVSRDYDSLNDVTSLGLHRLWKNNLAASVKKGNHWKILDVCCGTGDMALLMAEQNPNARVVGIDFSDEMLKKAKYRQIKKKLHNVEFLHMDAARLGFLDGEFDCVVISFGIREVADYSKVLKEMYRVLQPGGMFYCLDNSLMSNNAAQNALGIYRREVVPVISGFLAGNTKEYRHIAKENQKYMSKQQMATVLQKCGLVEVGFVEYTGGVAVCHRGKKPESFI